MSWQIKRVGWKFDHNQFGPSPENQKQLQECNEGFVKEIEVASVDGWEPWHMTGTMLGSVEYVTVWLKKASG